MEMNEEYVTNQYLIRALTNYVADSELADVAKTGRYEDLAGIPNNLATKEYVDEAIQKAIEKITKS